MRVSVTAALVFEMEFDLSPNLHDNKVVEEIYNISWNDQLKNALDIGAYDVNDIWVFDDDGNQIY